MEIKWEPKQSDIDWQRNMLGKIQDGGVWGSMSGIYTVNHKKKVLVRVAAGIDEATNERVKIVLQKLGWTMEDKCR